MKQPKHALAQLLPYGAMREIAKSVKSSGVAVTVALRNPKPAHLAVTQASRMVQQSGAVNTALARTILSG
jgi:hypothetical protein